MAKTDNTDSILQVLYPELWDEAFFVPSEAPALEQAPNLATSASPKKITFSSLFTESATCTRCALHTGRQQAVPSLGNPQAKLVIVMPPPSQAATAQAQLLLGPERDLLAKMLAAIHQQMESVYCLPVVRCHPPNSRAPSEAELQSCASFLEQELSLLKPAAILAMGESAARSLLATRATLESLRAPAPLFWNNIPVICSYTPADLLAKADLKRGAWDDLKRLASFLREGV